MSSDKTILWQIENHTTVFEDSRAGFHCEECGSFYSNADYTISGIDLDSGEVFTLCQERAELRCCGKNRPTPVGFFKPQDGKTYVKNLKGHWSKDKLIPVKNSELNLAHYRTEKKSLH